MSQSLMAGPLARRYFFEIPGEDGSDDFRWAEEVAAAKEFDWSPHLDANTTGALSATLLRAADIAEEMVRRESIAVGWTAIGCLKALCPSNSSQIGDRIRAVYPDQRNAQTGGPTLWNLLNEMATGDPVEVVFLMPNGERRL